MQGGETAEGCQRNDAENQKRVAKGAELGIEEDQHERENEAEDELEARFRALLVFEVPTPFDAIVLGIEGHLLGNALAGLRQEPRQVAAPVVELQRDVARIHPTGDGAFAQLQLDAGDLRERHERAAARGEQQASDRIRAVAGGFGKSDGGVVAPFADEDLTPRAAADADLDQVRHVCNIDAVARCRRAIDLDGELRQWGLLVDIEPHVLRAWHALQYLDDLFSDAAQLIEVVAKDSDDELAVHVEDAVGDALDDRLADMDFDARQLAEPRGHALNQTGHAAACGPLGARSQSNVGFNVRRRP